MKNRAYTRSQSEKALNKARKIAKKLVPENSQVAEKIAHQIRDNRNSCSCEMCRNPRTAKHTRGKGKKTIQER